MAKSAQTGHIVRVIDRFEEPVSSCVWAPDGMTFVTGCLYKERNLCQWNLNGDLIYDWGRSHRIQDLDVSSDGNRLVAMDNSNNIHIYNFVTRELEFEIDLGVMLSSVSISQDCRYILVSKTTGEAQLLDIETRKPTKLFTGQKGGNFVIRSAFGGANESFVISGSEGVFMQQYYLKAPSNDRLIDGYVFIWHKDNGSLIEKLDGHRPGCCNDVSWNPTDPCMFATAGDDMKVRM